MDIQLLKPHQLELPAECARCHTGLSQYDFLDFGLQIVQYGRVYICSACLKEIWEALGLIPVEQYDNLAEEYRDYITVSQDLESRHAQRVAELESEVADRDAVLGSRYSTFNSVPDFDVSGDISVGDADVPEATPERAPAAPKASRRPTKSNSGGGSKDAPSLEDFLGN